MKKENVMLKAALAYIAKGVPVFPVEPSGKKPYCPNGFKDATTDEQSVYGVWESWPDCNIGIPTGEKSGLLVFDIDADKGGFESLKALESKYGSFPATLEVVTGGGGLHRFFRYPKGLDIRNSAGKLGAGLDIRGNGGYVVAAPSLHASGRRYRKSKNSIRWPAPAPDWFLALLKESGKKTKTQSSKKGGKTDNMIASPDLLTLCRGVKEGRRNDSLARLAGALLRCHRSGFDPHMALELLLAWNDARCMPPLPRQEVVNTVNSIAGKELEKIKGKRAKE